MVASDARVSPSARRLMVPLVMAGVAELGWLGFLAWLAVKG